MPTELLVALIWLYVGSLFLGGYVCRQKGRDPQEGIALAFFFGPFGVIVAGLLPVIDRAAAPAGPSVPSAIVQDSVRRDNTHVSWVCSACGKRSKAEKEFSGRIGMCAHCQTKTMVP